MSKLLSSLTVKVMLQYLTLLLFLTVSRAELDRWAYLNNGGSVTRLAANKEALYVVTNDSVLIILQRNGIFTQVDTSVADVDVNDNYGVWITRNNGLFFREGVSSDNLVGSEWTQVAGNAKQVTSGRYGLLLIVNVIGEAYARAGITAYARTGSSWTFTNSLHVNKVSCGEKVCLLVNASGYLWSTGLLESIYSPTVSQWTPVEPGVKDISAYGNSRLWKVDGGGAAWEAVHLDRNFFHVSWERHSYKGAFKNIAVTDKIQFAVESDDFIKVFTGCPIFDFEDNNISLWKAEGDAFQKQPVVGQEVAYNRRSGKVGDRFIDTFSSRTSYEMAEGEASATQGDERTGTLKSPLFQIRTDMLHFIVGGGSYPSNYVGLYVQDVEVMRSSGESVDRVGPNGAVRSSRHWWDVGNHKSKCAYVKVIDQGKDAFGHTIFDDLRASPPCFKSMKVKIENFGHYGGGSVGRLVEYKLHLFGFYTSENRKLIVNVSYPLIGDTPYIYIENVRKNWVKCAAQFSLKRQIRSSPSLRRHWCTLSDTIGNYLLSDMTLQITIRVNDHHELPINSQKHINWIVRVNFAGEYMQKIAQRMRITRFGNETAKLLLKERFVTENDILVGNSISYRIDLVHHYTQSLQRAYNIMARLFLPPFMTAIDVKGLVTSKGDRKFSPSPSQLAVLIPELLLGERKRLTFLLRIDGNPSWGRKYLQKNEGQIIVDEISYCKRKSCQNALGNGTEISTFFRNKVYTFEFSYAKEDTSSKSQIYSKVATNGSIVIICGPYTHYGAGRCYFGNSSIWHKLNPILNNVSYYNIVNNEILGISCLKNKVKLHGDYFSRVQFLSEDQWQGIIKQKQDIVAATNVLTSSESLKEVHEQGALPNVWEWKCCK